MKEILDRTFATKENCKTVLVELLALSCKAAELTRE